MEKEIEFLLFIPLLCTPRHVSLNAVVLLMWVLKKSKSQRNPHNEINWDIDLKSPLLKDTGDTKSFSLKTLSLKNMNQFLTIFPFD